MLSIQFIRQNQELVRQALANRQDTTSIDEVLALDEQRRKLIAEAESLRAHHKKESKKYGAAKASGSEPSQAGIAQDLGKIRDRIKAIEAESAAIEEKLQDRLLRIPNIPHPSVPVGTPPDDNVVVRTWGEPRRFDFEPKAHWDLGEALDIIDFARGAKLSGTRFYLLKGAGAQLQRALIAFMLHCHIKYHGYTEIYPPFMVKQECLIGSSNLPKFADNLYHDAEEDFWFVPTAEVPLTNIHRDGILEANSLPRNYVAYTACFRREKMAAGKDTRGIKRGHQFDKVEMYKYTTPETSLDELERLVADAEDICQRLGFAYRVVQLCTGDLGFASAKTYDLEVWAPGCQEWLEVSSCSNCTDFQARRANLKYRPQPGAKPQFLHTLNGSGLALPRVLIAVLENYQQADGSILVPDALLPFTDGLSRIEKAA
ncbi:MAG: serine--tRNA ligase [Dehalococcoidia bacterium]|nr:serine--tRNA ligase [Dehalococcoidia bacterium]